MPPKGPPLTQRSNISYFKKCFLKLLVLGGLNGLLLSGSRPKQVGGVGGLPPASAPRNLRPHIRGVLGEESPHAEGEGSGGGRQPSRDKVLVKVP
jgi:hypothetical protein